MNSDPYDSAAWRTFGMLDADESAIFDEAMRHDPVLRSAYLEMDRISAAIAATTAAPIEPKAGQLERLHTRLNLNPSRRAYLWLGVSGWAAAAVLALLLYLNRNARLDQPATPSIATHQEATPVPPKAAPTSAENAAAIAANPKTPTTPPDTNAAETSVPVIREQDVKATVKVETKRLVQEIEVLRDSLEKFQHRDRVLFEAVPGMALPIVMRMSPPGAVDENANAIAANEDQASITTMLGDAMRVMTTAGKQGLEAGPVVLADPSLVSEHPTAIPIYDAARDSGTLVVSNLPPVEIGKVYNLWVKTATGDKPIYVGSLPESSASGADSFDFSLGSNMVLPSGFVLTKDPQNAPSNPTESNTVLQGPPVPPR